VLSKSVFFILRFQQLCLGLHVCNWWRNLCCSCTGGLAARISLLLLLLPASHCSQNRPGGAYKSAKSTHIIYEYRGRRDDFVKEIRLSIPCPKNLLLSKRFVFLSHVLYIYIYIYIHLKKLSRIDGENRILCWISSMVTFRVRTIDKMDEACTNADDQKMFVRHRSGDRVMS